MAKVSIAKLLKTKNRLASEITRVKSKIKQHNSYYDLKNQPSEPEVNVTTLAKDLVTLTDKLISVKSAINSANVKASSKIYKLAEVKGQISFWENVDCENTNTLLSYAYGSNAENERVKKVQISLNERDQIVKDLIKESQILQDELDEFNSTQRIEIDEDVIL